jgi:prevent-host-death family protein
MEFFRPSTNFAHPNNRLTTDSLESSSEVQYSLTSLDSFGELLPIMQSRRNPRAARRSTKVAYHALPAWKLQDAKARFSQVVREALEHGPQRVTLHGKDAVVILSAEAYGRLAPAAAQPSLHMLLSRSPLRDLDFEHGSVRPPVRDVEL